MSTDAPLVTLPLEPIRRGLRLVLSALRRRWLVIVACTVAFTGAGYTAAKLTPRTWTTEMRVLTRKTYLMPALVDPRRAVPFSAEAPAQAAAHLVLQRSTLEKVVRDARLVERWAGERAWILVQKDRLLESLSGPRTSVEQFDATVNLLASRLRVQVNEEVISIKATWNSPQAAYDIVQAAYAGFQAERLRTDVESVEQSAKILAERTAAAQREVDLRLQQAQATFSRAQSEARTRKQAAHLAVAASQPMEKEESPSEYAARLMRARRDERRVALQLQLAEQTGVLGEAHPDRIALREALDQLDALDAKDGPLPAAIGTAGARGTRGKLSAASAILESDDPNEDTEVTYARAMLRIAVDAYQDMTMRLDNAQLEAATARAAAAFRYMVTQPAEVPRRPASPNALIMIIGGFVAGLVAGMLAAVAREIRIRAGGWSEAPDFVVRTITGTDSQTVTAPTSEAIPQAVPA